MANSDYSSGNSIGFWIAGIILVVVVVGSWLLGQQLQDPSNPFPPNSDESIELTTPNASPPSDASPVDEPQSGGLNPAEVAPEPVEPVAPSFDTLRVAEDGVVVAAGRANPGDQVLIYRNAEVVARVDSNQRGEWVWVPDEPLPAGNHALQLRISPEEGPALLSDPVMVLGPVMSEALEGSETPRTVVALGNNTDQDDVQVLQRDDANTVASNPDDTDLALETVQWGVDRPLSMSGTGPAGEALALTMDGDRLGTVLVDSSGRWQFSTQRILAPGDHEVTLQVGDSPAQQFPFTIEAESDDPNAVPDTGERVIVIKPGNNLWRIAEATYGSGFRYTLIFQANQGQISDPDLIFPGQVFTLPSVDQ